MKKLLLFLLVAFAFSVFIPEIEAVPSSPLAAKAKAATKKKKAQKPRRMKHRKLHKKQAFVPALQPAALA